MSALQFTAEILIREGNPYILVSKTRANTLKTGWRKPMPVIIRVNGQPQEPWHINMMPTGTGAFYLYLHGEVRQASHTKVGDRVTVDISFDQTYHGGPMHPMPEWFKKPLEADPAAKKGWDALTPSRQKEILRYLSWLKSDEARERNVAKALQVLGGQTGRYMARTWKDGK